MKFDYIESHFKHKEKEMDQIYKSPVFVNNSIWEKYDDLLVIYFELVCDFKDQTEVVEELWAWKEMYPVEWCIVVTKNKGLKLPHAYLLMRDGCAEESIDLFMVVLQEKETVIKKNDLFYGIPNFRVTGEVDSSTTPRVQFFDSILHECLTICKENVPTMTEQK